MTLNRRHTTRGAAVTLLAVLAVLGFAAPAQAAPFERNVGWGEISGSISVVNDQTSASLIVKRLSGNKCVYAEIDVDRTGRPDAQFKSVRLCRNGDSDYVELDTPRLDGTRGALVKICQDIRLGRDNCVDIHYEPEIIV